MNPDAIPAARPDLDTALFDFAEEYAREGERALYRLQLLVLDEDTCLARVAFLQALAQDAGRQSPPLDARQAVRSFGDEIALLCEEGLLAAHAAGRLTPDRIARLDKLTRDPEALLATHRRLVGDGEDSDPARPGPDATSPTKDDTGSTTRPAGFTELVRAGRVADLEDRLRPWLPFLLRRAGLADGLDEGLARLFLAYVRTRIDEVKDRRFRELLSVWVRDFARQQNRAGRLRPDPAAPTAADLEADAVERVLRRAGDDESEWARSFRESALRSGLHDARALLSFEPAGVGDVAAMPSYRRDLFSEAHRAKQEGLELFECEAAA
jgi:hypothetical protein